MGKIVTNLGNYRELWQYDNGIAVVKNGTTGLIHSIYPNIDKSGCVHGMKQLGYWKKDDTIVTAGGFKYNISKLIFDRHDTDDMIAYKKCNCVGCKKIQKV